ncbi:THO complex subunit 7A [Orobanche gracilis]
MLRGRKVGVRGETMAAHYAFGPVEDDIIIKHRLLTRTTTTRGEPPLKKLQKKFTALTMELEKESDNYGDCERLAKAFLQELNTFEIPLLKSRAVIDANVREKENFNELKEEINRQILQAQGDIEVLKKQLEESKIERQHKEECEAIRKLVAMQPPRSETQKIITELEKEIAMLEAENTSGSRTLDLRKKQFALLLHVDNIFKDDSYWPTMMHGVASLEAAPVPGTSWGRVRDEDGLDSSPKRFYAGGFGQRIGDVFDRILGTNRGRPVDELQNTIEEEQKSLMEEMRTAIDEHRTSGLEDANGGTDAMAVD